jgi:hypothetical protein
MGNSNIFDSGKTNGGRGDYLHEPVVGRSAWKNG